MGDPENSWLIGVDGGGTACRVALVCAGRRYEATLGAANVTTDPPGAMTTVRRGIAEVCSKAGIGVDRLALTRAHVALAGVMSKADQQAVAVGLDLARVTVSDDRVSTVAGALGGADGVVAGIGTGSFLARQTDRQMRFVGGWGHELGDEASGAWLGRGLLAATLRAVDGLADGSDLSGATLDRFGTAAGIVSFAATASAREFAELAPSVVLAARQGDALAQALMRQGADYILRGLRVLGWTRDMPVCLTGGLGASYEPWLAGDLRAAVRDPKGSALDGALQLAARIGAAP